MQFPCKYHIERLCKARPYCKTHMFSHFADLRQRCLVSDLFSYLAFSFIVLSSLSSSVCVYSVLLAFSSRASLLSASPLVRFARYRHIAATSSIMSATTRMSYCFSLLEVCGGMRDEGGGFFSHFIRRSPQSYMIGAEMAAQLVESGSSAKNRSPLVARV